MKSARMSDEIFASVFDFRGGDGNYLDSFPKYPPLDIVRYPAKKGMAYEFESEEQYEFEFAVAGFKKQDISISEQEKDGQKFLCVSGFSIHCKKGKDIVHNGIARRNFHIKFALAGNAEVKSAKMADGILCILVELEELPNSGSNRPVEIEEKTTQYGTGGVGPHESEKNDPQHGMGAGTL